MDGPNSFSYIVIVAVDILESTNRNTPPAYTVN